MDIKELIQHLANHIKRDPQQIPDDGVQKFLRVLEEVREDEMPCSEVYARLDEYVEKEMQRGDAAILMPLLKEHLDLCTDCCEEYETLLNVLEKTSRQT
jgi:hypothetical protein